MILSRKKQPRFLFFYFLVMPLCLWLAACDVSPRIKQGEKPNVLFIAVDDLNDWTGFLGTNPQSRTPNLDKLAADGIYFTRAYTAAPSCNPSRVAVLTGLHPTTTGIYQNAQLYRKYLPDTVIIPQHFRDSGYYTLGSGKIAHGRNVDEKSWDLYEPTDHQRFDDPQPERRNFNGMHTGLFDWGVLPVEDKDMSDVQTVEWIEKQLTRKFDKPVLMGVGWYRPHLPWYVPQKYFDLVPALEDIKLPETREDDLDDIPPVAFDLKEQATHVAMHNAVVEHGQWKPAVRSYLASIRFTDAMVGRLMAALEHSPYASNTIVVLWSDHGIHLGQKKHWRKWTLWEESLHIPLIIKVPKNLVAELPQGTDNDSFSDRVVSLIDIYPTLVQLCHLETVKGLQGHSLLPLLQNPEAEWPHMALSSYRKGNSSLRSERWHYIHYADGSEELYDHNSDPHEFTNLAKNSAFAAVLQQHRALLPTREADEPSGRSQDDGDE
jgi:arylsulfatase A-like enzyme